MKPFLSRGMILSAFAVLTLFAAVRSVHADKLSGTISQNAHNKRR
jgi:hypothetical protein